MRLGGHAAVLPIIGLLAVSSAVGACGGDSDEEGGDRRGEGGQTRQQPKPDPLPEAIPVTKQDEKEVRAVAKKFFATTSRGDYGTACSLYAPEGLSELGGQALCTKFLEQRGTDIGIPAGVPTIARVTFIDRGAAAFVSFEDLDIGIEMDRLQDRWAVDEVGGY